MNYQNVRFTASYGTSAQLPPSTHREVSFVGRSNVGKSSLMNKLFNRKNLVKVSSKPGKTSTVNFFTCDNVDFVDLPGYGFAQVSKEEKKRWQDLIDGYFIQERNHALCVVLVDIRHDVSRLDIQMIEFLQAQGIPFVIAFTKADKIGKTKQKPQMKALCKQLSIAGDTYVVLCSALSGSGIDDLKALIGEFLERAGHRAR
ncbi:MAG: ribosome biogenesis GTP-binding protein YihA/YsxC [Eggerthellaceae bacterium]|jgi:GTP-binding protein